MDKKYFHVVGYFGIMKAYKAWDNTNGERLKEHLAKQEETRRRIAQALMDLLEHHAINSIKVTDICRISGVSRSTFYIYFCDPQSVGQWVWDSLCHESLYRINRGLSWDDGHTALFDGLYQNKRFYMRMFAEKDFASLFSYGYRQSLVTHIDNLERRLGRALTMDEQLELDYSIRALSAMTSKWAEEGMEVPVPWMVKLCHRFVPTFAILDMVSAD